ncbi:MAG: hypothetical protein HYZ13_03320 [Acidobacteria bacterium]|nr:hypothetical protein [Acidobacteriota bacterium]
MRIPAMLALGLALVPLPALAAPPQGAPEDRRFIRDTEIERRNQRVTAQPLEVRLDAPAWYAEGDAPSVRFTISNPNSHSVWVLRWELPTTERAERDLFQMHRNGVEVTYEGRLTKRVEPRAIDYVEIKAHDSYSVVVDLSADYDLDSAGDYRIQFRQPQLPVRTALAAATPSMIAPDGEGKLPSVLPTHVAEVREAVSAQFFFPGVPAELARKEQAPDQSLVGSYSGCTTTQKSQLSTAHANAKTMTSKALTWLNGHTSGGGLYLTWFGAYNSSRFSTVKSHYTKILDEFNTKTVNFDCNCTDSGTYAYVYPSSPYKIYLCGAFWRAPSTGTDSKAGTLVHESSHFTVNGGTQDYVYGTSGAKSLAISNPSKAVMNADNHEYFAEYQ